MWSCVWHIPSEAAGERARFMALDSRKRPDLPAGPGARAEDGAGAGVAADATRAEAQALDAAVTVASASAVDGAASESALGAAVVSTRRT
jgi:hypothetical protein